MMKKNGIIGLCLLGLTSLTYAQTTGKVGIETDDPQETLEVNGTLRVKKLPLDGTNALYNGTATPNGQFNATKYVVTDNQGNLGTLNSGLWRIDDVDVTSRFNPIPTYSPSEVTRNSLTEIAGSEIRLTVNSNTNKVAIDWDANFQRTDAQGNVRTQAAYVANIAFKITLRVYRGNSIIREIPLGEEYFYQDNVRAYFSKNMPVKYTAENLRKGTYRFRLCIGKSNSFDYENRNDFYIKSTSIVGEGKVYVK